LKKLVENRVGSHEDILTGLDGNGTLKPPQNQPIDELEAVALAVFKGRREP
jgi:hypothetical protein